MKHADPLRWPRLFVLLLAIAISVAPAFVTGVDDGLHMLAYFMWAVWLLLGVVGFVLRFTHRQAIR